MSYGGLQLEKLESDRAMKIENRWYDLYTLENFLNEYDDEVYITYMETGAYYDTEYEDFIDWMYESKLVERFSQVS